MAKIVIAGSADCPYYAKCELLADKLMKSLPDFKLHKIVKPTAEWQNWLSSTCTERGWLHKRSPIVWRELVDRGGKGMLIGGANDFQEYAKGYYGEKSSFTSDDMTKIAGENLQTKQEVDEEERQFKSLSQPIHVCITSAAGPVAYSMIHAISKGDVFGPETEVWLHLLDTSDNVSMLKGNEMESFDLACNLLRGITVTTDMREAFNQCSAVVLLDELEKGEEEAKESWLKKNHDHFIEYAKALDEAALKDVKVLVASSGPVNFNVYMMLQNIKDIPHENFIGLSRLVENRAKGILAEKLNVNSAGVVDVSVWGNVNGTTYTDISKTRVHRYDGAIWGPPSYSVSATEMIHDDKWVQTEFVDLLSQRKALLETEMRHSTAMSQAAACNTMLSHWWNGAPAEQFFSLTVKSNGDYDVPEGLVFSFPARLTESGGWNIVKDLQVSDDDKIKLQTIIKELVSEIEVIYPPPYVPPPTPPPETQTETVEEAPSAPTPGDNEGEKSQDSADGEETAAAAAAASDEEDEDKPVLEKIEEDRAGEEQAATEMTKDVPPPE